MKPNVKRKVFTLVKRQYITPHYIRLTLTHPQTSDYVNTTVGVNNKIFIAPKGVDQVHFPTIDPKSNQPIEVEKHLTPIMRTYTHRGIDLQNNLIWIDFVAHGQDSPASDFAINAPIGAELGVAMGVLPKELYPDVDWYLLAGDATAIPVLGAILESLDSSKTAQVIIEVESYQDVQDLTYSCKAQITWLINPTPGRNSQLADKVKEIVDQQPWGEQTKFGYLASEMQSIKELRTYLRKQKQWSAQDLYAYSYWKYGNAETDSLADRRQEKDSAD
ncbi:siderophore-interacting protein [Myroides sp. LJL119]